MKRYAWILLVVLILAVGAIIVMTQTKPAITKTVQVILQIKPSPSFNLAVTPDPLITYPNRTAVYSVTCTAVNDFAGEVTLSVTGVPSGVTATFVPSATFTLGPDAPKGANLELAVSQSAVVGTYSITITATSTNYN